MALIVCARVVIYVGYLLSGNTPRAVVPEPGRFAEFVENVGVWKLRGGRAVKLGLCHVSVWHIPILLW